MATKRETMRHLEAFEYYFSLGDDRTYKLVAEKFNVTPASVQRWATDFKWLMRVTEREHHIALKIARDNDKQIYEDKKAYRKIIKATLNKYTEKLRAGKSDDPSIKDVIALMEMDLKLMDRLDNGLYDTINKKTVNVSDDTESTLSKVLADLDKLEDVESEEDDEDVDIDLGGDEDA